MEETHFLYVHDAGGVFTYLSPSISRILGYTPQEFMTHYSTYLTDHPVNREVARNTNLGLAGRKQPSYEVQIHHKDGGTRWLMVSETPMVNDHGEVLGIQGIAQDITQRKYSEEALSLNYERMRQTIAGIIHTIAKIVESRDPFTAGHQMRVAELALAMGRWMKLDPERLQGLHTAALIHDIGKIHVPAEILSKPGKLTAIEFEMIRTHSKFGHEILKSIEFPWPVADIILQHHERLDGSGYPAGLRGEAILLEARIIAVADVVEAMAMHRPYRSVPGLDRALAEIRDHRNIYYDNDAVEACLTLFFEKDFKFITDIEPRDFSIV